MFGSVSNIHIPLSSRVVEMGALLNARRGASCFTVSPCVLMVRVFFNVNNNHPVSRFSALADIVFWAWYFGAATWCTSAWRVQRCQWTGFGPPKPSSSTFGSSSNTRYRSCAGDEMALVRASAVFFFLVQRAFLSLFPSLFFLSSPFPSLSLSLSL